MGVAEVCLIFALNLPLTFLSAIKQAPLMTNIKYAEWLFRQSLYCAGCLTPSSTTFFLLYIN